MTNNAINNQEFRGLSTDTKPVNGTDASLIRNGDVYVEMDTGEVYFFNVDTNTWILPS